MFSTFLLLIHILGLTMAVGVGAAKVLLLLKCRRDLSLLPAYFQLVKPMTGMLIAGFIMVTLSGIGWLVTGYPMTGLMWLKIALVVAVWGVGPYIDNVVEPVMVKLAPKPGEAPSAEFLAVQSKHFALEVLAEGLFIAIIFIWVVLTRL